MILSLKLDDDLYAKYAEKSPANPQKALVATLEKFVEVNPHERTLFIAGTDRQEIEKSLGMTLENPAQLVAAVKRLSEINVGKFSLFLTESQRKRISQIAKFWKQEPDLFLTERVKTSIRNEFGY